MFRFSRLLFFPIKPCAIVSIPSSFNLFYFKLSSRIDSQEVMKPLIFKAVMYCLRNSIVKFIKVLTLPIWAVGPYHLVLLLSFLDLLRVH